MNPSNTFGGYEANEVQTIVPGLGMLAYSHTGIMNIAILKPMITYQFHHSKDPSTGASTNFYDLYCIATNGDDISLGSEFLLNVVILV